MLGMAITGSFVEGHPDEFSDLDLRVVLGDGAFRRFFSERGRFLERCGDPVAAFTGEHVGEPNLVITLFDDLVHVDFLFAEIGEMPERNDGRAVRVLWERDPRVGDAFGPPYAPDPRADLAWLEDRVWTWACYTQSKILRGELYEALSALSWMREWVLFRVLAVRSSIRVRGARFAEDLVGEHGRRIASTVARPDPGSAMDALRTTVDLYVLLADPLLAREGVPRSNRARAVVIHALEASLDWRPERPS